MTWYIKTSRGQWNCINPLKLTLSYLCCFIYSKIPKSLTRNSNAFPHPCYCYTQTLLNTLKDAEKPCYTLQLSALIRWFEWIQKQYRLEQGRTVHELVTSSENRTRTLVLASRWNVPAQQPQNISNDSMQICHITNCGSFRSRQKLFHISQTRMSSNRPSAGRLLHHPYDNYISYQPSINDIMQCSLFTCPHLSYSL